jgi:hypothetical protein|tara:strand:- start:79 stop:588 length:510 start_codon:yes stop_codon:yes gene_type:complete
MASLSEPISTSTSAPAPKQSADERRAEIMKKLAAAKAERAATADTTKEPVLDSKDYGTHSGITCDGCNVQPMVGYRWRCKNCDNHDLCDACYDEFKNGKLLHANARRNPISQKLSDHAFFCFAEPGVFKPMVKQKGAASGPTKKKKKKLKPNDPCHCGSGKKLKKCCKK